MAQIKPIMLLSVSHKIFVGFFKILSTMHDKLSLLAVCKSYKSLSAQNMTRMN